MSEEAALDGLDELLEAGFISPAEGYKLRFDHTLTMEVAYREVGELRHRHLHRRVAEAMENRYLEGPEQRDGQITGQITGKTAGQTAGQIAWHFAEGNAHQRATRYALKAGRQAANLAAWREASEYYELALKGLTGAARLPALQGLAEALSRTGDYPRACEVLRDTLAEAIEAKVDHAQIEQIQLALARSLMPQARFSEVIELAEQIRTSCAPQSEAAAELMWGTALSLEGASLQEAADHLHNAESLWRQNRSSDLASLSQIQFELGNVLAQQGEIAQAVEVYRQALESAEQVPSDDALEQRILALNNLAYHMLLLGDPAAEDFGKAGLSWRRKKACWGCKPIFIRPWVKSIWPGATWRRRRHIFKMAWCWRRVISIQERVAGITANLGLVAAEQGETALAIHRLSTALGQADALGTRHLAALVRIWLAPLLPPEPARQILAEARLIAEQSGRERLIAEIERLGGSKLARYGDCLVL